MMKAAGQDVPEPKPILELNPNNPLVSQIERAGCLLSGVGKALP